MVLLRLNRYLAAVPPSGPIVHAATFLRRPPGWGRARTFSKFNHAVEAQLASAEGALAYSLQRGLLGRSAWTLSLWADRKSMLAFVGSGVHKEAARWLRGDSAFGGKFVDWEAPTPSLSWNDVYARLGMPAPVGRVLQAPTSIPPGWQQAPE
jgi:hypothetical protein